MTAEAKKKFIMRRVDLVNSETEQDILIREAQRDSAAFARQYRVIFGDLRIEDVSAGRLAELQAE